MGDTSEANSFVAASFRENFLNRIQRGQSGELLAADQLLWLDKPHRVFRYPEFPLLPTGLEKPSLYARSLIYPPAPNQVRLGSSLPSVLRESLLDLKVPRGLELLTQSPPGWDLFESAQSLGLRPTEFSRDPEQWEGWPAAERIAAIVLSNPHRADGFFYPQELYEELYRKLRSNYPQTALVSEESYNLFSFNSVEPGSLKKFLAQDPRLVVAGSVYPALSPQGPELSWTVGTQLVTLQSSLAPEFLNEGLRALMAWGSRQGAAVQEFHRRMLALNINLREFTDLIGPALQRQQIRIPHWPDAGFFLSLDFAPVIQSRSLSDSLELCVDLARREKICLLPGATFGSPYTAYLCFAAGPKNLRDAAARLLRYLSES